MRGWNRWNNATVFLFISSGKSLLSLQQFPFGSCHHFTVSVYSFWHLQSIFHPEFPLFMQFSNVILQLTQYDAVCGSLFPSWSLSIGRFGGGGEGGGGKGREGMQDWVERRLANSRRWSSVYGQENFQLERHHNVTFAAFCGIFASK